MLSSPLHGGGQDQVKREIKWCEHWEEQSKIPRQVCMAEG